MQKIFIKTLSRHKTNKNGEPYTDRDGLVVEKVSIFDGAQYYSCFDGPNGWTTNWQGGQTIEVDVVDKVVGSTVFHNIYPVGKKGNSFGSRIDKLEADVKQLQDMVMGKVQTPKDWSETKAETNRPATGTEEELPF